MVDWNGIPSGSRSGSSLASLFTSGDRGRTSGRAHDAHEGLDFRTLFDTIPDPIFVYDADGTILDVNLPGCEFQHCDRAHLLGADVWASLALEEPAAWGSRASSLLGGALNLQDWPGWIAGREHTPVEIRTRPLVFNGAPATLLLLKDLTPRLEAFRHVIELERRAVSILDIPTDAIVVTDKQGMVCWVNRSALTLFGYSGDEFESIHIGNVIPCHRAISVQAVTACLFGCVDRVPGNLPSDARGRKHNGESFPIEGIVKEMVFDGEPRYVAFLRDVSKERRLEHEVLHATEIERESVGQEIHDLLASRFSAIALTTRGVINQFGDTATVSPVLEEIVQLAREGARSARALARGLNPVVLDKVGLRPALEELKTQIIALSNAVCTLDLGSEDLDLDAHQAAQLYRIAYEAVNNALKHARATKMSISVRALDGMLALVVSDNGVGFRADQEHDGLGLHILNYRANLLGGSIRVDSNPGVGTTVTCRIPNPGLAERNGLHRVHADA